MEELWMDIYTLSEQIKKATGIACSLIDNAILDFNIPY